MTTLLASRCLPTHPFTHSHVHTRTCLPTPRRTFLSTSNAALRDPHCGDRICTAPLEFAGWHDDEFGCSSDCGEWHNTTRVHVRLTLDNSLPQEDVEEIRWNIFCTDVEVFRMEMRLFDEDQTFHDVNSSFDEVLDMMDCNYDLRIYAPKGGVDGSITIIGAESNTTRFTDRACAARVRACGFARACAGLRVLSVPARI